MPINAEFDDSQKFKEVLFYFNINTLEHFLMLNIPDKHMYSMYVLQLDCAKKFTQYLDIWLTF